MPFLGKDWRSNGDHWIRTELGWERTKVLECILDNLNNGLKKENGRSAKKKQRNDSKRTNSNGTEDFEEDERLSEENSSSSANLKEQSSSCREGDETSSSSASLASSLSISSDIVNKSNQDDEEDDEDERSLTFDLNSDDEDQEENHDDDILSEYEESCLTNNRQMRKQYNAFRKLCISNSPAQSYKTRQPHIIYLGFDVSNRENNAPKASVSEVLNALDMPGAVKDIKRFNYVCKLVQLIINEKLNQLSGNAQRTLFIIVKEMLIQVMRTQENVNVMRKLLIDFKKKIQDSYFYYFYYIGSQKLCERHLAIITKWQEMLENPNHKPVKRLMSKQGGPLSKKLSNSEDCSENVDKENAATKNTSFENIPVDCKLEIMRRLNTGLDLVNLAKCNRSLNDIVSKELTIWKNLCQFHFQQTHINTFLNKPMMLKPTSAVNDGSNNPRGGVDKNITCSSSHHGEANTYGSNFTDTDWKLIYFRLKRRYGHREVYTDMIHKCLYCKSLFWKEIGHPCPITASLGNDKSLEIRTEPITPKRLIDLLLR